MSNVIIERHKLLKENVNQYPKRSKLSGEIAARGYRHPTRIL